MEETSVLVKPASVLQYDYSRDIPRALHIVCYDSVVGVLDMLGLDRKRPVKTRAVHGQISKNDDRTRRDAWMTMHLTSINAKTLKRNS